MDVKSLIAKARELTAEMQQRKDAEHAQRLRAANAIALEKAQKFYTGAKDSMLERAAEGHSFVVISLRNEDLEGCSGPPCKSFWESDTIAHIIINQATADGFRVEMVTGRSTDDMSLHLRW